ncbi:BTB/POZ domain-containing protein 6-A-like [Ixodes scapularis]|uniref:BTB/POZ domain-containing protein 6-A-like n=1 Tax=Ixodes scapularis TaxID=6945 RepID=UPI001A9D4D03|nr:BTB/POZ domain-containing protein 6-A-like [Ixodes scapularis]
MWLFQMAKPATTPIVALPRSDLSFFSDGRYTDVEFLVENGSDPPKRFKAHKMVLAMRNEVFEVMFYGNLPEQDKVIITDLHPDGFFCFLKYLYSQSANFADIPQALYIRSAAQKYMESKLVDACDAFIKVMQPRDVCAVLNYAIEHENLTNFENEIGMHLEKSGLQVLESSTFISASIETVIRVLKNPRLKVKEYEVIKCVYAWAIAHCRHENGEPSASALRESMKPFLSELRFLTLSSQEFIAGPSSWNIFTESEAFSVLSNIITLGSMPFPDGVSTVTVGRVPAHL